MGEFEFLEAIKDLPEEKKYESVIIILTSFSQERDKKLAAKFLIVKGCILNPLPKDILEDIFNLIKEE
jgi:hypothetical protein